MTHTCGSCPYRSWSARPTSRLNFWSLPPSSTSAFSATESYPCISGYMNSTMEIGRPSA